MKKRSIKNLKLNKKSISNLKKQKLVGAIDVTGWRCWISFVEGPCPI